MEIKSVLSSQLWSVWNLIRTEDRYQNFLLNRRNDLVSFFDNLLLYNRLCIPTQDFLIIPIILNFIHEKQFLDLIESKSIQFIRIKGAFGYAGNGLGLQKVEIFKNKDGSIKEPFCSEIEQSIDWALSSQAVKIKEKEVFKHFISENTKELNLVQHLQEIKDETYNDIKSNQQLLSYFAERNVDLDRLLGVESNQLRIFGSTEITKNDEIETYLKLVHANQELKLLSEFNIDDIQTSGFMGNILNAKFSRTTQSTSKLYAVETLREISEIPCIGNGIINKTIPFEKIIKIRKNRSFKTFVSWFHELDHQNPQEVRKEYVKLLKKEYFIQKLPVRILRYLVATGLGFIPDVGIALGPVAAGADSFFVDRFFKGKSPKIIFEKLETF